MKLKPRRSFEVTVCNPFEQDTKAVIRSDGVRSFVLSDANEETIAICDSAKRLSDWAFEHGALEVRHDYDLKLSDGEM